MMTELLAAGIAWGVFLIALISIYCVDKIARYVGR
jgi:hypothetical protein